MRGVVVLVLFLGAQEIRADPCEVTSSQITSGSLATRQTLAIELNGLVKKIASVDGKATNVLEGDLLQAMQRVPDSATFCQLTLRAVTCLVRSKDNKVAGQAALALMPTVNRACTPPPSAPRNSKPRSKARGQISKPKPTDTNKTGSPDETTRVSKDETTCLNEWVLQIARESTEAAAEARKKEFVRLYKEFSHVSKRGDNIWADEVHVVRSIDDYPREWLVVIDMYEGPSCFECMLTGLSELIAVLEAKPDIPGDTGRRHWEDTFGRMFLRGAEPLCYDLAQFEKAHGKIRNGGRDLDVQRSYGPCDQRRFRTTPTCSNGKDSDTWRGLDAASP